MQRILLMTVEDVVQGTMTLFMEQFSGCSNNVGPVDVRLTELDECVWTCT